VITQIRKFLQQRPDSEHEQVLIRLLIAGLILAYTLLAYNNDWLSKSAEPVFLVYAGFLLLATGLLGWILLHPPVCHSRRLLGVVLDMTGLGASLYYLGEAGAVLFPIYIWVIVGNGLRYGQKYLYTAMGLAGASILWIMLYSAYWSSHLYVSAGFIIGMIALPIYFSALLGRLNRSNNALQSVIMRLAQMAQQDPLTGLPNRSLFHSILRQTLAAAQRYGRSFAVIFLDLDGFKKINDTLGHAVGDELICTVGKRLRASIRESDMVARLGGDEFVVLLNEVTQKDVDRVADKLLQALSAPLQLGDASRHLSASIGVALYPGAGEDPDTILDHADTAMYRAKQAGKNRYYLYPPMGPEQGLQPATS
jgi:diguanylate cyclase (GGDEF)-like protein